MTKKKCIARIVQDGNNTAVPTYTVMMDNYKKNRKESSYAVLLLQ